MTADQHEANVTPDVPNTDASEPTSEVSENILKQKFGDDWEAAGQSYTEIVNQRKAIEAERNALKQQLAEYQTALLQRESPTTTAQAKASALAQLAKEWALPEDQLAAAIDERFESKFTAAMQPLIGGAQAQNAMVEKYGKGYLDAYHEHMKHVNSDPDLRETFEALDRAGKTRQALEFAKTSYESSKPVTSKPDPTTRNAASLPSGAAGSTPAGQRNAAAGEKGKPDLSALARAASQGGGDRALNAYWGAALEDIPLTFEQAVASEVKRKQR